MTLTTAILLTTLSAAATQSAPAAGTAPAARTTTSVERIRTTPGGAPPAAPRDPHHRIEVRFGGWTDGWYGYDDRWDDDLGDWRSSGTAQGTFGLEYLSFIRQDFGIGLGLSGLGNATGDWAGWHRSGEVRATVSVPVVARWYPVRRLTPVRALEPYVTAGIGPVFGVDTRGISEIDTRRWRTRDTASTRVATGVGGRVGGGVDLRIGSVFTLGVAGAWNWDAGLPGDHWRGSRPNGGEFAVTMGVAWR
jgi:hypothetical protein